MWIILASLFVIGLCAIIANIFDLIGTIIKHVAAPLLIVGLVIFILLCIFC